MSQKPKDKSLFGTSFTVEIAQINGQWTLNLLENCNPLTFRGLFGHKPTQEEITTTLSEGLAKLLSQEPVHRQSEWEKEEGIALQDRAYAFSVQSRCNTKPILVSTSKGNWNHHP